MPQKSTDREDRDEIQFLQASEGFFRTLFESAPVGIVISDPAGRFLLTNRALQEMFGYSAEQLAAMSYEDITFPDDLEASREGYAAVARGERGSFRLLKRYVAKSGELLWGEAIGIPLRDLQGVQIRLIAFVRDVTEQKRAEAALRESEAKFRGLAERSFDIIFVADTEGRVTYVSPSLERILGYRPEEVLGKHYGEFLVEEEVSRASRLFDERLSGANHGIVEIEARRKDGRSVFLEINSSPVFEGGRLIGLEGIVRDVTERRAMEERLRQMQSELAHVARLSTMGEMIAGIAHELNQPLFSILNFGKACCNILAADGEPDLAKLREWMEAITLAAGRAGTIVGQLRAFAQRAPPVRKQVKINDVVQDSLRLTAFEARRRRVTVELDLCDSSSQVSVDPVQIQQVLVNLLQNAFEAMDDPRFTVRQVTIRTRARGDEVEVSVGDRGPGVPAEGRLQIFNPFVTTKPQGLGMGLAISRSIVEAHGGRMWATAHPAGGAIFSFALPLLTGD